MEYIKAKPVAHSYESDVFNRASADVVVPIMLDKFDIKSVVDIGCGIATWLAVFAGLGINDYLGVDSLHVDLSKLEIGEDHFRTANFESFEPLNKRFDLCVSLEVAEHLSETVSDDFVKNLTDLSDVVLFSAAIPGQTGQHHVNLQWPDYWAEKFQHYGYSCCDFIRPLIRDNEKVDWWYQQNILVFLNDNIEFNGDVAVPSSYIHPQQYQKVLGRLERLQLSARRSLLQKIKDLF